MRSKSFFTVVGILCLGLMVVFCATGPAQAQSKGEVVKLKLANYFPPTGGQSLIFEDFIKELEARSNGRIQIQYLAGGSLLTGPAMYKGLESGIADIGYSHVYYTAGRMPVSEFVGLPFGYPSSWVATCVLNDFYAKYKQKEFDNVKLLFFTGSPPNVILSTKAIRTLEDLKGVILRAPGVAGDVVSALGGTPSPVPVAETYEAISKGICGGTLLCFEGLKTFRLADVVKYATDCWRIGTMYPFYLAMNKNSYKKLPPDLKEIFDTVVGIYSERLAMLWAQIDIVGKIFGAEKGVQFIDLPEQEALRWKESQKPLIESWVKKLAGMGYTESEVRAWIPYIQERIEFYTKKQIELRIPSATGPVGMRPESVGK